MLVRRGVAALTLIVGLVCLILSVTPVAAQEPDIAQAVDVPTLDEVVAELQAGDRFWIAPEFDTGGLRGDLRETIGQARTLARLDLYVIVVGSDATIDPAGVRAALGGEVTVAQFTPLQYNLSTGELCDVTAEAAQLEAADALAGANPAVALDAFVRAVAAQPDCTPSGATSSIEIAQIEIPTWLVAVVAGAGVLCAGLIVRRRIWPDSSAQPAATTSALAASTEPPWPSSDLDILGPVADESPAEAE